MLEHSSPCPICGDRKLILSEHGATPCSCVSQEQKIRRQKRAGITAELSLAQFRSFSLNYYSNTLNYADKSLTYQKGAALALQAAIDFVQTFQINPQTNGLMFVGPVGSGKTFLAAAIANALLALDREVLFLVVPDFLDALRNEYRQSSNLLSKDNRSLQQSEYDSIMDNARQAPLLILDDLGSHNYTDWTRNTIYSLLNYRLNHSLPVIITTNLDLRELEDCLGERSTSRIIDLCRNFPLMVATDIRHRKFQERESKFREQNHEIERIER